MTDAVIARADVVDAGEILTVQRAAYVSEAQLYGTPRFSALTETLEEMRAAIETGGVLAARLGTRIVGAVRAVRDGRSCEVARLVVAPDMRRQGIGGALISAVEADLAGEVDRFWLFTGDRSTANMRLYAKSGYEVTHSRQVAPELALVYLEKRVPLR
jgi:GNAT superfamily N-acetyltransferase